MDGAIKTVDEIVAWLDQIVELNSLSRFSAARNGEAYASVWPAYESQTPQYPFPSPYNLAFEGYRKNELIYSCIHKWEVAIAQAPLKVYQEAKDATANPRKHKTLIELPDHPLRKLLAAPNECFSADTMMRATETYLKVAGFSAWEIETNNFGEPLAFWPMRPDWCSFRRGVGKPLEFIRYQPYGLPFADIPIERVLLFQCFDPIYPLLKALSPSAVSMRVASVDNAITDFLKLFFQHGAVVNGVLITDQTLDDAEAKRIRARWREQHGGVDNWTDVAVLGAGVKYQDAGKDFRAMDFQTIDAREEIRICEAFHIDPIIVNAKVGTDVSSYNNKEQAHRGWHREEVVPEWKWIASETARQMKRFFPDLAAGAIILKHDTSNVYALDEDRSSLWKDVIEAVKTNLLYRDRALELIGEDPVDNDIVFIGASVRATDTGSLAGEIAGDTLPGTSVAEAAKNFERKQFQVYARKRIAEGHPEKIKSFAFKHLNPAEQAATLREAQAQAKRASPFSVTKVTSVKAKVEFGSDAHRAQMEQFEKRARSHEEKVSAAAQGLFERQKADVLARVRKAGPAVDPFDVDEWIAEFDEAITPLLKAAMLDAGKAALSDLGIGIDFDVDDPNVVKFLLKRKQKFAVKLNKDTYRELKDSLAEGVNVGENIADLEKRIEQIMGDKIRSSPETIARTEVISSVNRGTLESWNQSGVVKKKTWLAALDNRTREWHAEAHGQTVNIDEPFIVNGEEMDHPGDQAGSAENVINCRCSMTATVD